MVENAGKLFFIVSWQKKKKTQFSLFLLRAPTSGSVPVKDGLVVRFRFVPCPKFVLQVEKRLVINFVESRLSVRLCSVFT